MGFPFKSNKTLSLFVTSLVVFISNGYIVCSCTRTSFSFQDEVSRLFTILFKRIESIIALPDSRVNSYSPRNSKLAIQCAKPNTGVYTVLFSSRFSFKELYISSSLCEKTILKRGLTRYSIVVGFRLSLIGPGFGERLILIL